LNKGSPKPAALGPMKWDGQGHPLNNYG